MAWSYLCTHWGWMAQCAALVVPIAAVLHNAVFYRSSCMLNPFGSDYIPPVLGSWLSRDPSLPWAMVCAVAVFAAGSVTQTAAIVRACVLPFVIAFLPLSLWIWDIPFTGRSICGLLHDGRLVLPILGPARSKHLYVLGMVLFSLIMLVRLPALLAKPTGVSPSAMLR